jgi:hypothetical protein
MIKRLDTMQHTLTRSFLVSYVAPAAGLLALGTALMLNRERAQSSLSALSALWKS